MSNLEIQGFEPDSKLDESDPFAEQNKKIADLMSQIDPIIIGEVERLNILGVVVIVIPDYTISNVTPYRKHFPNKARDVATEVDANFHMARFLYDAAIRLFKNNKNLVFRRADREDPQPSPQP